MKATKLSRTLGKLTLGLKKNSPLILTIAGVVGLGATAYTAYKARDRVKEIVEDIEEQRDIEQGYNDRYTELKNVPLDRLTDDERMELQEMQANPVAELDRVKVARDLVGAVALPISLGVASVCAITLSYHIMNTRVGNLAAAVATLSAERAYYEKKFEREYGVEKKRDFYRPAEEGNVETVDEKGKKKVVTGQVRKQMPDSIHGKWFDESDEFVSDDHEYNKAFIEQKTQRLQDFIFARGYLTLNQMLDTLGFDKVRYGSDMGWTTADNFNIYTDTINELTPEGDFVPTIYIKWSTPKFIYDQMDYANEVAGF